MGPEQRITRIGLGNKAARAVWWWVYQFGFRWTPAPLHAWRRLVLRCFGAQLARGVRVYPKARIWAPWHLVMAEDSTLANDVDCYCVAPIHVGARAIVSQYTYLCAASHDYTDPGFALVARPIHVGADCWVAADVFVGPGVSIGDGTVVGARSSVFGDLPEWSICVGSPARRIKARPRLHASAG